MKSHWSTQYNGEGKEQITPLNDNLRQPLKIYQNRAEQIQRDITPTCTTSFNIGCIQLCIQLCHLPVSSSHLLLPCHREDSVLYPPLYTSCSWENVSYFCFICCYGIFLPPVAALDNSQIFRSPHTKISLGFTVKSKLIPVHATTHKQNSQGQNTF